MISNQVIQTNIEELKGITKVDFLVYDIDCNCIASTMQDALFEDSMILLLNHMRTARLFPAAISLKLLMKANWHMY